MNFTPSGNTSFPSKIKTGYSVALATVALAVGVAIGGFAAPGVSNDPLSPSRAAVPIQRDAASASTSPATALSPLVGESLTGYQGLAPADGSGIAAGLNRPSSLLVYIVGSETEKRSLEQEAALFPEWFGQSVPGIKVRLIALEPGMDDFPELDRLLPEAMLTSSNGPQLKLVDMR